jgi:hypothetical protein
MCKYRTQARISAAMINRFAIFLLHHDRRLTDTELEQYRSKQAKIKKYGDTAKNT